MSSKALEEFKRALAEPLGPTPVGCCIICKQPFTDANVHTDLGWKETRISQTCEVCFDNLFGGE